MKLRQLKEWINSLPEDYAGFNAVVSKEGVMEGEELTYRLDMPIRSVAIDESTKELTIIIDEEVALTKDMIDEEVAAPPGNGTLDGTPGMGQATYASRDAEGSGDVPTDGKKKKKKKRRIHLFDDFFKMP